MLSKQLIQAAAGNAGGEVLGVEDVFSTWLYTGTGTSQTITNGIDLAGEGGLVWIKSRSGIGDHILGHDATDYLTSNSTAQANPHGGTYVSAFNSTGFSIGVGDAVNKATSPGPNYTSWTFRKAPKFFDVVTFTSSGAASQQIAHNLGSVPGFIILKRLNSASGWFMYHRSLDATSPANWGLDFTTAARDNNAGYWNNTQPTSTHFTIGNLYQGNTHNYVAYLFAHDAGGFGDSENESVVKCGSFTTNASGYIPEVDLGWEPQFLLYKASSTTGNWEIADTMRRWNVSLGSDGGNYNSLYPNLSNAEAVGAAGPVVKSTGFGSPGNFNFGANTTFIYIAIRRGPMKTPTDATKVFAIDSYGAATGSPPTWTSGWAVDTALRKYTQSAAGWQMFSRLSGTQWLRTNTTDAQATDANGKFDFMNGWGNYGGQDTTYLSWMFRRAPGFFDAVCYTGTGANRTVNHNLGVVPELMIVKRRNTAASWAVYSAATGNGDSLILNSSDQAYASNIWNDTTPSASVFSLANSAFANGSGDTYIAYLFASCPGVSKVGSYTGTGTTLNIDCGFTAGARFVLIKRTDSTGDWYVWDTARGIVSGNDPYLLLNSTAAEVTNTDYIDPLSSGFQISSTAPAAINANGGSFIYLAIA